MSGAIIAGGKVLLKINLKQLYETMEMQA